jgi:hypothetical protein
MSPFIDVIIEIPEGYRDYIANYKWPDNYNCKRTDEDNGCATYEIFEQFSPIYLIT